MPSYLFAEIAKRVNEFTAKNPDKKIIRLGIGDVTLPLAPAVVEAMKKGCDEMGVKETFKGYPDYEGYGFLREAISEYYESFGVSVSPDEILINDGAKSDARNIGDIFSADQHGSCYRSGLSGICRFKYNGRKKNPLCRRKRRKRFLRYARSGRKGRYNLSLLS